MSIRLRLVVLALLPASLFAATLRVNNAPGTSPDHPTIQAAINAAADGDTILIEGSTTAYSPFTLTNKRLNLIGPGYGLAANPGTPANKLTATIVATTTANYITTNTSTPGSADGSLVMGLEFNYDLFLEGCANVTVARCLFNSQSASGHLNFRGPNNVARQCFFRGSTTSLLSFDSRASGTRIENCLIPDAPLYVGSSGISVLYLRNTLVNRIDYLGGATLVVDNNIFLSSFSIPSGSSGTAVFNNNLFPSSVPPSVIGSGNLAYASQTSLMANIGAPTATFDGRYQLAPLTAANPAYNAGTDGTHIGPFGGANPYILSGVPPLPTIDELSVPQFAAPGGNLTIRIKVGERP